MTQNPTPTEPTPTSPLPGGPGGAGRAAPAPPGRLVIKVTCGAERAETANQALNVAATALAVGAEVSLWLSGEATWFAVAGRQPTLDLELATPAADLLAAVLAEGSVTVCTQCAARRDLTAEDLLPQARIAGSAAFVAEILRPGTQALVY